VESIVSNAKIFFPIRETDKPSCSSCLEYTVDVPELYYRL
jgi:hypothetical protein